MTSDTSYFLFEAGFTKPVVLKSFSQVDFRYSTFKCPNGIVKHMTFDFSHQKGLLASLCFLRERMYPFSLRV